MKPDTAWIYKYSDGHSNYNTDATGRPGINVGDNWAKILLMDNIPAPSGLGGKYVVVAKALTPGARGLMDLADGKPYAMSADISGVTEANGNLVRQHKSSVYSGYEYTFSVNGSPVYLNPTSGSGIYAMLCLMKADDYNYIQNYTAIHKAWVDKTSPEWSDYNTKEAAAQAKYDAEKAQYDADKAQYDADIVTYNTLYANYLIALADYSKKLDAYNKYLADMEKYKKDYADYLKALDEYNEYLKEYERIRYVYALYCNEVIFGDSSDKSILLFSLVKIKGTCYQTTHLFVGDLVKYDSWGGGIIFSGSANRYNMLECNFVYKDANTKKVTYPLLSSCKVTNTYLRINATRITTGAGWASSGEDNVTGLKMSLPIRDGSAGTIVGNGKVKNYSFLQSANRLDWGKNVSITTGTTTDLTIDVSVMTRPLKFNNYACVGRIHGIYFISLLNTQTAEVYGINKVISEGKCQVFPMERRRGYYGFDGISVYQQGEYRIDDFDNMQALVDTTKTSTPVINIINTATGITAYGGDTTFTNPNMPGSSILLSVPYKSYDSLIIHCTEDSGTNIYTVTWDMDDFVSAMSSSTVFDLLKGQPSGIFWRINPSRSTDTILVGGGQNCGIIDIIGYKR